MTLEALIAEREKVQAAIDNILEAGQEYQTRSSRVKFANLNDLYNQRAYLDSAIAAAQGNNSDVVHLQFGGFE